MPGNMINVGLGFLLCPLLLISAAHAQEQYVQTSDGVRLYVNVKGSGTPCLYVHGGPGAGSYFLEELVGESLETRFRMIYLDQRGSGRSESPGDGNYSMDRMVADFEEVRSALGIGKWITLGHSFGGLLQMGYAKRCPDVIQGMVMINCTLSLRDSFENSWFPKACELLNIEDRRPYQDTTRSLKARLDSLLAQLLERDLIWKMAFASRDDVESMNAAISAVPRGNREFETVALGIQDYGVDFLDDSAAMRMPVLFFYGTRDWMIGPEHWKHVRFPNMLLWETDLEHMSPFLGDNRIELQRAVQAFADKYGF